MTTTALVWLVVGLLSLVAVLAVLIALIRHLFVLGRAAGRFQDEVGPLTREIGELADSASADRRASGPEVRSLNRGGSTMALTRASRPRIADPERHLEPHRERRARC